MSAQFISSLKFYILTPQFVEITLLLFSAFGLGTMIYTGLEFGAFFEIPFNSPCHQILRGVNPLLQMIFTFMQMYFILMNARVGLNSISLTTSACVTFFMHLTKSYLLLAEHSSIQAHRTVRFDAHSSYKSLRLDQNSYIGEPQRNHSLPPKKLSGRF